MITDSRNFSCHKMKTNKHYVKYALTICYRCTHCSKPVACPYLQITCWETLLNTYFNNKTYHVIRKEIYTRLTVLEAVYFTFNHCISIFYLICCCWYPQKCLAEHRTYMTEMCKRDWHAISDYVPFSPIFVSLFSIFTIRKQICNHFAAYLVFKIITGTWLSQRQRFLCYV